MEPAGSSETPVMSYQTTRDHIPEDSNRYASWISSALFTEGNF
jgi:hypothetical protein